MMSVHVLDTRMLPASHYRRHRSRDYKPADSSPYIFQRYALTHQRASSRTIRVNEADARDVKGN